MEARKQGSEKIEKQDFVQTQMRVLRLRLPLKTRQTTLRFILERIFSDSGRQSLIARTLQFNFLEACSSRPRPEVRWLRRRAQLSSFHRAPCATL